MYLDFITDCCILHMKLFHLFMTHRMSSSTDSPEHQMKSIK